MARQQGIDLTWLVPIVIVLILAQFVPSLWWAIAGGIVVALFLMAVEAVRGGVGRH
jgi:hypothetical protein